MSAKTMYEGKEKLCKLFDEIIRNGEIKLGDLEAIESLTTSIKNIMRINEMDEGGYSYGGEWSANGRSYNRGYSNDGMSNAGYSNNGSYGGMTNGGYSNRGSYGDNEDSMSGRRMHYVRGHYSRAGEDMLTEKIEEMMDDNRLSVDDKSTLRRAMDILRK